MNFDKVERELLQGLTNSASCLEDIEEEQEELLHEEAEADEESRETKSSNREIKSEKAKAQRKRKSKDAGFRLYTPSKEAINNDFCPIRFWINVTLLTVTFIVWLVLNS